MMQVRAKAITTTTGIPTMEKGARAKTARIIRSAAPNLPLIERESLAGKQFHRQPGSCEMSVDSSDDPAAQKAASELNNLLEIISGTSSALENIWAGNDGAQKYFEMLRTSVDRAAAVTAELAERAGGTDEKVLLHPELMDFIRPRKPSIPPVKKARHLLVVDDEPMALVLARRILS